MEEEQLADGATLTGTRERGVFEQVNRNSKTRLPRL